MIDRSDPHWYRDAIIYQLHVKSFFDANDDGIGDFAGATAKLDYISDLGATAIWVMPFYPSPLRDDGYDIMDYRTVNPAYGSLRDFRQFLRAAHDRGLRVIIELVINHTSDQHPWFQRARAAPPGSAARNFYVWADDNQKYSDARIIFLDTETSNWTWDPAAGAYFWHRFYSHQPDLNFDNPAVLRAVIQTMFFWLDMGVDGLRLDAIPYLIERDGTNCENLSETHAILRKIRAALDARYPDRMLLAEANQWPEDTAQYFGSGDECHMAFHFPLMPRMYMAIAQEDRHPVTDIIRQTPDIPAGAQWAIFLRNHDELTLEMVTQNERDYLWAFYASDRRARINLGIRRRLAPLLENDRRKIELMASLLMSMPGTPVLYYGDEIGMGDNIYLGDRDGVRTPMQWSPDRNGGFSRADPARLFLPTLQDPVYGFAALNVEAESANSASFLNWMRRLVKLRRTRAAFGRGAIRFLYPQNRKVLAYIREFEDQRILCVANLSRAPQAVELDLSEFKARRPVELMASSPFPLIGDLPYLLTLASYGFYWFDIADAPQEEARFGPPVSPELFTLVLTGQLDSLLTGRERDAFERAIAPPFLVGQRWFARKGRSLPKVKLRHAVSMRNAEDRAAFLLTQIDVSQGGNAQTYFLPLAFRESLGSEEEQALLPYAAARVRRGARVGLAYDGASSPEFLQALLHCLRTAAELPADGGAYHFRPTELLADEPDPPLSGIHRLSAEQSNTSVALGDGMILKFYRRLSQGIHPELEVSRYLTETVRFPNTPALLGNIQFVGEDGGCTAIAVLQCFVENQGDGWSWTLGVLQRELDSFSLIPPDQAPPFDQIFAGDLPHITRIGQRTAEMHIAFARAPSDLDAFAAEPLTQSDMAAAVEDTLSWADRAFAAMEDLAVADSAVTALRDRRAECLAAIRDLAVAPAGAIKTRIHGDYHLGQVLIVQDDVMIVDFEGEPSRSQAERRGKFTPLRDVAGMMRSLSYAGELAARDMANRLPDSQSRIVNAMQSWRAAVTAAFLAAYRETAAGSPIWIDDAATRQALLKLSLLAKAFYEIVYEARHRPDWVDVPARGLLDILDSAEVSI